MDLYFLAGLMITNAVTAELISSKLIDIPLEFNLLGWHVGPFTTIVGVLPWPVVFVDRFDQRVLRREGNAEVVMDNSGDDCLLFYHHFMGIANTGFLRYYRSGFGHQ